MNLPHRSRARAVLDRVCPPTQREASRARVHGSSPWLLHLRVRCMHRSVHAMHAPHEQLSAIAPAAKSSATDSWLGGPVADRPHPCSRPGCPGCPRSPRAAAAAAAARPGAPTALPWSSYSGIRCAQTAGQCGPPTPPGMSSDQRARWSLVVCRGQGC